MYLRELHLRKIQIYTLFWRQLYLHRTLTHVDFNIIKIETVPILERLLLAQSPQDPRISLTVRGKAAIKVPPADRKAFSPMKASPERERKSPGRSCA